MDMRNVLVAMISLDAKGRPVIKPVLPPEEDFEFVWRAARSTRWIPALRALAIVEDSKLSPTDSVRCILESTAGEYGCNLVLTDQTDWAGVPSSLQGQLRAAFAAVA
jgi:sugar (pentulose or hexulose) kinase